MRTLKYTLGLGLFVLLFASCDDVDDTPPRLVDMKTEFVLPAPRSFDQMLNGILFRLKRCLPRSNWKLRSLNE